MSTLYTPFFTRMSKARRWIPVAIRLLVAGCSLLLADPATAQSPADAAGRETAQEPAQGMSKEAKALWLNVGVGAFALGWGAWSWDWGTSGPRFQSEGWFGHATVEGGADKLGHAWSGYALSHLFAGQYRRWGYTDRKSIEYGVISSIGTMGLIEVGDSLSDKYGFSYEDMLSNIAGAGFGYLLWQYPDLASKLDFRVEYNPFRHGGYQADIFTDYQRLKYLLAIKADGFAFIQNPALRYLELQIGYYARNYEEYSRNRGGPDVRERHFYIGVGLNVTKLLQPVWDTPIFNYFQMPYTYVPAYDRRLER